MYGSINFLPFHFQIELSTRHFLHTGSREAEEAGLYRLVYNVQKFFSYIRYIEMVKTSRKLRMVVVRTYKVITSMGGYILYPKVPKGSQGLGGTEFEFKAFPRSRRYRVRIQGVPKVEY